MGLFNTYNGVQLKVSKNLSLTNYKEGVEADIEDGVYVGYEDIVVILKGLVQKTLPLRDKWGRIIDHKEFLGRKNRLNYPCCNLIEEMLGESVLEMILKDYAPDIEFLGETLDTLKVFYKESDVSIVNLTLKVIDQMAYASMAKCCRIYTNPATDTMFQLSFSLI